MSNDNVVDFTKAKLITAPQETPKKVSDEPVASDFDFYLLDGTVYRGTGFLVATSAWVGLGDGTGKINVIIPMTNLSYVEAAQSEVEEG